MYRILDNIKSQFKIIKTAEITIEANPEDITKESVQFFEDVGINRVSIGIQSFNDRNLTFMNRAHSGVQSIQALEILTQSKISNISADLMFGLIDNTTENLEQDLRQMTHFNLPHLSVYNLTIEEQTVFANWKQKSKINELSDVLQKEQFYLISDFLAGQNYNHYEISNYAKEGATAKHNTNYWNRVNYLGFGPSAHSLVDNLRSWNVSNNAKYIKYSKDHIIERESEMLSVIDQYNEIVMLGLRRKKGIAKTNGLNKLPGLLQEFFYSSVSPLIKEGILLESDQWIRLHPDFWYVSDDIASALFYTNDE